MTTTERIESHATALTQIFVKAAEEYQITHQLPRSDFALLAAAQLTAQLIAKQDKEDSAYEIMDGFVEDVIDLCEYKLHEC